MKLPMKWLREFADMAEAVSVKEYSDKMTATGSKVEGYETLGDDIDNVVVGKILKIEQHPDADKLVVCSLDTGEGSPRQIVTGAKNVFEGAYVPVAKSPANLPGGVKIKSGKLRGVESNGMLCSISELNLTTGDMPGADEDGILILNEPNMVIGQDIKDLLHLSDQVVEFEITPNRPDCLCVIGLARESAVTFGKDFFLHTPKLKNQSLQAKIDAIKADLCTDFSMKFASELADHITVDVKNGELCKRYTAMAVKNVKIEPSPLWLRMRLRAAGVRPINNIVDITNYVMLEYGQPMHAFDSSCIDGKKIVVRNANNGEIFKSLDDKDHILSDKMLVIADEKKAIALAGVMGGANSEIKDSTNVVIFESASFDGPSVRATSRALGMRTESSGRYEKGLDSENTLPAIVRACELVELLGAGEVVDGIIDVYKTRPIERKIPLDFEKINAFLGVNLGAKYMTRVLISLGFDVTNSVVTPPSFRADVECMSDLAEEIIRIYGYNNIESTAFKSSVKTGKFTARQELKNKIADRLLGIGLTEICTYSFVPPSYNDKICLAADDSRRNMVVISNPIGEETSVMRTSLIPSILEVFLHNINYQNENVALFENGTVYLKQPENTDTGATSDPEMTSLPLEPMHTVLGFYGDGDFYKLKGYLDSLLELIGIKNATYRSCKDNPTFHPGRCAEALVGDYKFATLGQIHPNVANNYGFEVPVYVCEIDTEGLLELVNYERKYAPVPRFPSVTRDFSFICDEELEAARVMSVISMAVGKLLEKITIFDVYRGSQLPENKKSMSFSVTLRAPDRTLTEEDASKAVKKILTMTERELGLTLRV